MANIVINNYGYQKDGDATIDFVGQPSVLRAEGNKVIFSIDNRTLDFVQGVDNVTIANASQTGKTAQQVVDTLRGLFSSTGNTANSETASVASALSAQGSTLDTRKRDLLDNFITGCKNDGTWDDIVYLHVPGLSVNLAGALIPIKYGNGNAVLTNQNLVAADFTEENGFSIATNTNKQLQTGFIPDNNGLSNTNICFGVAVVDFQNPTAAGIGGVFGDNPATGNIVISASLGGGLGMGVGAFGSQTAWGPRTAVANYNGANYQFFMNGVASRSATDYTVVSPAIGPTNTEITIFKYRLGGADRFAPSSYAGMFFSKGTTLAKASLLSKRWKTFIEGLHRRTAMKWLFEGDSITQGQTVDSAYNRYGFKMAQRAGLLESNIGMPNARMTVSVTTAMSGLDRQPYIDYTNVAIHSIMYGTNDSTADADPNGDSTLITTYRTSLATKIAADKAKAVRTIVCSMPWNSGGQTTKYAAYTQAAAAEAKIAKVAFANMYDIIANKATPSSFFTDGVHPNALGHAELFKVLNYAYLGQLYNEVPLTPGLIAAGAVYTADVALRNAEPGMQAWFNPLYAADAGLTFSAKITANDLVKVQIKNETGGGITPTAGAYYAIGCNLNY